MSGKKSINENSVKTQLFEIKKILDSIIPDYTGSYKQKDVDVLLKELLHINNLLNTIQLSNSIDNINSDDITDGPRPEYFKLLCLYNGIELMAHKMYLNNILECIKRDNNIAHDTDTICTPLELGYIRKYQKQIEHINNSKVTQT